MSVLLIGFLLTALAASPHAANPADKVFFTGQLTEDVQSISAPGQRFTLYLPTGFDAERPTPVIYLLDPRGRARVPAKVFQEAAERFGYLLVSSHATTSDGAMEPNLQAIQAMWDDTNRWFTIDPKRTYVAGFSGTARVASLLAQHRPITGIIGVGAGFHPDVRPSAMTSFLYFGAIGEVDYNFHEMATLEHSLAALDLPHRVERFPGPHAWLTPDVAMRAVEWLELRAMQAGQRPVDADLVDAWWARDDGLAQDWIAKGRMLDTSRQYAAMARDFAGFRDVTVVAAAAKRIGASAEAKDELSRRKAETRRSDAWVNDALQTIAEAFPDGEASPLISVEELARQLTLGELRRTAAGADRVAAREAQRRLNQIGVQAGFYLPADALARSEFVRADYYLSLGMQIDDGSPVSWYLKAQWFARLKDPHGAIAALRRAIDFGFRDLPLMEADQAFQRLRGSPDYAAIVDLLRSEGDRLDVLTVDRPPVHVLR